MDVVFGEATGKDIGWGNLVWANSSIRVVAIQGLKMPETNVQILTKAASFLNVVPRKAGDPQIQWIMP